MQPPPLYATLFSESLVLVQIGSVLIKQGIGKFVSTSGVYLNNTCLTANATANPDTDVTSVVWEKHVKVLTESDHKDVV